LNVGVIIIWHSKKVIQSQINPQNISN